MEFLVFGDGLAFDETDERMKARRDTGGPVEITIKVFVSSNTTGWMRCDTAKCGSYGDVSQCYTVWTDPRRSCEGV